MKKISTYPQTIDNVEHITRELAGVFNNAAKTSGLFVKPKTINYTSNSKPWFGPNCHRERLKYRKARQLYQLTKSEINKINLKYASKKYKKTMNFYIKQHNDSKAKKLREMNGNC